MTNEELNAVRTVFREEANAMRVAVREELNTFRAVVREEVNAAVYASETRLMARMDQMEGRLDRLEDQVRKVEVGMQNLRVDLSETIHVLNEATKAINELQRSQQALEERVEDNTLSIKRDVQALNATVHNFGRQFIEMNGATNDRLTAHERMPFDQAHHRPHSAA